MYGQTPVNITFVALQQMNAAGEVVFENQKLYDFLKANSTPNPDNTGKDVLLFDFNDLTERYLIATGVVPGIITPPNGPAPNGSGGFTGAFPPVGEFIGQRWHRRATLSATPPKIGDLPTTLQWDGTAWVTPRFELLAKAFEHFTVDDDGTGKWQPIGCYLRSDGQWRAALEYNPDVEFYNKGQVVFKVVGGAKRWYRSKAADNETSPTQENSTIASAKWEWGLTEAEMCNLFNKSAASILDAVATFAESDYSSAVSAAQIVARVEKLILAHAASNSEALARVTDQKFLTPANLPSLTASQAEVLAGTEATKFVTSATLQGKVATPAEATAGTDATKLMTPATTDAAIIAATTDGLNTWSTGKDGSNGNAIVIGSDGKLYLANPNGQPATNDPTVAANRPAHWQGAFNSIGDMLAALAGAGSRPNGWEIDDVNCATGMIKFKKPDGTTCTMFTKELKGVVITMPTTAKGGTTVNASASTPTNGTAPYTYSWKLPDGSTATGQSITFPLGATAGTYSVVCTVTDSQGMTVTKDQSITVTAAAPVVLYSGNSGSSGQVILSENANKFTRLTVSLTQGGMKDGFNYTIPYTIGGSATQGRVTLAPDGVSMTVNVVAGDPGSAGDNWVYNVTGYYD